MEHEGTSREKYIRRILDAYRKIPGTTGRVRREDRLLAASLHEKGVPSFMVENAFVLGAARRLLRPPDMPALQPIRSMHYFLPLIDEVAALPVGQNYYDYLQDKIDRFLKNPKGD